MKKLLSIILISVMLLSVFALTANAESLYECKDAFLEKYNLTGNEDYFTYYEIGDMDINCNDAMDFVLVYATIGEPADMPVFIDMGERFIYSPHTWSPFESGYGMFSLDTREFVPLSEQVILDYPWIDYYLDAFDIGELYGDADGDGELTVIDATLIQLELVNPEPYADAEGISGKNRRSDYDRDLQVSVMDATAIQKKLAKV